MLLLPLGSCLADAYGLYKQTRSGPTTRLLTTSSASFTSRRSAPGSSLRGMGAGLASPPFTRMVVFWAFAITFVTIDRAAGRALLPAQRPYLQNTVIVGAGSVGQLIARKLLEHPRVRLQSARVHRRSAPKRTTQIGGLPSSAGPRACGVVRSFRIERVIFAFSNDSHEDMLELIRCSRFDCRSTSCRGSSRSWSRRRATRSRACRWSAYRGSGCPGSRLLEATLDRVSSVAIVLLRRCSLAAIDQARFAWPRFFRQPRVGSGAGFRIFKFRTMVTTPTSARARSPT